MKTPEEWAKRWRDNQGLNLEYFFQQAQEEAFLEGQLKGLTDGKTVAMTVINEVFGNPTKSELTSIE